MGMGALLLFELLNMQPGAWGRNPYQRTRENGLFCKGQRCHRGHETGRELHMKWVRRDISGH